MAALVATEKVTAVEQEVEDEEDEVKAAAQRRMLNKMLNRGKMPTTDVITVVDFEYAGGGGMGYGPDEYYGLHQEEEGEDDGDEEEDINMDADAAVGYLPQYSQENNLTNIGQPGDGDDGGDGIEDLFTDQQAAAGVGVLVDGAEPEQGEEAAEDDHVAATGAPASKKKMLNELRALTAGGGLNFDFTGAPSHGECLICFTTTMRGHGLTSTFDCLKKEDHLLCRRCCGKVEGGRCPYCNIKVAAAVQQQNDDDDGKDDDGKDDDGKDDSKEVCIVCPQLLRLPPVMFAFIVCPQLFALN